jgi:hypothetical protein
MKVRQMAATNGATMSVWRWGAMAMVGIVIMVGIVAIGTNLAPVNAETPDELLRRSLAKLGVSELKIAYSLHPEVCTIGSLKDQKRIVECEGVPLHFYRMATICNPDPPDTCAPATSTYTDCRSFFWFVDESGEPEDLFGNRKHPYNSLEGDCRLKGTLESDRAEMDKHGFALVPVKIYDFAGRYTPKPRP